jgi:epsilon-lactone hydrolase
MSWQNVALKLFLRMRVKPTSRDPDVEKSRRLVRKLALKPRLPQGWRVRELFLPPMKGEWIEPDGADETAPKHSRAILYLHGGGYFFHSPRTYRPITFGLASGAEIPLFALDYRLAPEHCFPAAVDDAVEAYRRLLMDGIPAGQIVIAGDSAGGGLALATLCSLRDHGDKLPAGAVLFSPWTDLAATGDTLRTNDARDPMFYGDGIAKAARFYLGDMPGTNPLASPLYADLRELPPLLIQASDIEVLLDDSHRLVEKARTDGVSVLYKEWPGLPHVWQLFAPHLPEARAALSEASAFIYSRLA